MAISSREHLEQVSEWAEKYLRDYGADYELHNKLCDYLKSALAEPPRNCDIGTPEEQENRFDAFCKGVNGCRDCIIYIRGQNGYCHSAWSQMPYKKGGSK